jgi:hypothetical protein
MSGFSFSKLKQAKPSMRRRLFLYMGALAALLLVTLFAVLLLLGQLKSPREELAKSLTFRMEAFQSDMESLWRNVSVMGLHLSEDMTAILEKQTTDLSKLGTRTLWSGWRRLCWSRCASMSVRRTAPARSWC